jgi:hypothetical protein
LTGHVVAQGVKQQLYNREQTTWNLMDKKTLDQGFLQAVPQIHLLKTWKPVVVS